MLSFIGSDGCLFVYIGDDMLTIRKDHPRYEEIRQCIAQEAPEAVKSLLDSGNHESKPLEEKEKILIEADTVIYNGRRFTNKTMVDIIRRLEEVDNVAVRHFVERVCLNPNPQSAQMLMSFLAHHHLPLTVDGRFLAYKAVDENYKDYHSKSFNNSPGQTLAMDRSDVEFDEHTACSSGFHVGTLDYAKDFVRPGGKLVICVVDPFHVVSVPIDESHQKLRTAQYTVLCDFEEVLNNYEIYKTDGSPMFFTEYLSDLREKEYDLFKLTLDREKEADKPELTEEEDWEGEREDTD